MGHTFVRTVTAWEPLKGGVQRENPSDDARGHTEETRWAEPFAGYQVQVRRKKCSFYPDVAGTFQATYVRFWVPRHETHVDKLYCGHNR